MCSKTFVKTCRLSQRTGDEARENVFTFFSAVIGGPCEHKGADMVAAHKTMAEQCPITEAAFHAIAHHVLETMEKHESGDAQEKEEVLAVLVLLKPDVASKSFRCPQRMTSPCATA
jgi:truncated hemoglobin YjbI